MPPVEINPGSAPVVSTGIIILLYYYKFATLDIVKTEMFLHNTVLNVFMNFSVMCFMSQLCHTRLEMWLGVVHLIIDLWSSFKLCDFAIMFVNKINVLNSSYSCLA